MADLDAPGLAARTPDWIAYFKKFHTSSSELAKIATEAKPGTLILYHHIVEYNTRLHYLTQIFLAPISYRALSYAPLDL